MLCAAFFSTAAAQTNPAATVSIDANANRHPINPNIYGAAYFRSAADIKQFNLPTNRIGGNNDSTYNWNIQLDAPSGVTLPSGDAINLDNDWFFESYLESTSPGGSRDSIISASNQAGIGTQTIVTIPMLPYIATVAPNANTGSASLWAFSIQKYGPQVTNPCANGNTNQGSDSADPYQPDAGFGIKAATLNGDGSCTLTYVKNVPADAYVPNSPAIQKAYVQYLVSKYGGAANGGIKYYMLDNEPSDWDGTHRDVHPNPETYDEIWSDIQAYAGVIKEADPNAIVIGPEEWSWWAMWESEKDQANGIGSGSDYATHNNTYYYPWLLQQLAAYKKANGVNLIDVLSAHCYTDDYGSVPATINTRELWDPSYQDTNWYTSGGLNGGVIEWIPLMQQWIQQYDPGLQTGCTEYTNWGDDNTLSGIGTQADMFGIFGYYGLDFANTYTGPYNNSTLTPSYLAFEIYRNYDDNLSTFGDTSVSTTVANPDKLSSFAALRSSDGAMTVMVINKQTGSTPVTVNLANFSSTGAAQAYQISSVSQTSINSLGSLTVKNNSISTTVPSQSVTLFVIPAATAAPSAPTNLTAAGGNGLVTLNWTASVGAATYNIYRGAAAGGEGGTPIATGVTSTTYVDKPVTNGTPYYYKIDAVNGIGPSGMSNEASATPLASDPSFTATATASPNPATQNSSTTLTVAVTCTANSMTNGSVSIVVVDPTGKVAQTTPETSQSFTSGQTLTYTPAIVPTVVGTYTVEVNVSGSGGQLWAAIPSAGTFTVNAAPPPAAPAFTITGGATPATMSANGSATITATFKNTGGPLTNGNLELQVYNGSTVIGGIAPNYNAINIASGASQTLSFTWTPSTQSPPFTTPGTYNIVGLAWADNYTAEYTQTTVGTITIQAAVTPPPAAPTSLKATAGDATVSLTWTGSSGATSYNVYRGTSSGGESSTPIATNVASPSYTDSNLTDGTAYYYEVAAVDSAGTSGMSSEVSATPRVSGANAGATFTLTASSPQTVAAGTSATSTITVSTANGYAGTVTISCALTSYPNNAQDLPSCFSGASTVSLSSGATAGATTVTIHSTGTSADNRRPWAGGGAVLAFLVLFGIPARRRSWRSMLCALALVAALGAFSGCTSGAVLKSGNTQQGTTSGTYIFTVTGTGNPGVTPLPTTTFTVTIQ
jgi:fibronectin type 3 domain-containing protein